MSGTAPHQQCSLLLFDLTSYNYFMWRLINITAEQINILEPLQKRNMKKNGSRKKSKKQEEKFVGNWSPHDRKKQYDALEDPHAQYYFCNKSVNNHLKVLRRAVNGEKNEKEKQKLRNLISTRLKLKLPEINNVPNKTMIYMDEINKSDHELLKTHCRKISDSETHKNCELKQKNSLYSINGDTRYRKTGKQVLELSRNNQTQEKLNTTENQSSNPKIVVSRKKTESVELTLKKSTKAVELIHNTNHARFLEFLAKKRSGLESKIAQPKVPTEGEGQKPQRDE